MASSDAAGGMGRLLGHGLAFIGTEVLNKAIPFLLIPLLTRVLTPEDFGRSATFLVLVGICTVLAGLGAHGAVSVAYFRLTRDELAGYVTSVLALLGVSVPLLCGVLVIGGAALARWLSLPTLWVFVALFVAASQFVTTVGLVLWQCERRPGRYATFQLAQTAITALTTLGLVVGLGWDWRGQAAGVAASAFLFGVISFVTLRRRGLLSWRPERRWMRDAAAFSAPLIPHGLAGWALTGIDRVVLTTMAGPAVTGIYAAGYQLGQPVGIVAAGMNRAWTPYLFGRLGGLDAPGQRRLVRQIYLGFGAMLALAVAVAVVVTFASRWIWGPAFQAAARVTPWIALAYAFDGMYYLVVNQIFFVKRTAHLATITALTGLVHVTSTILLVRRFGLIGAAWATTISFGVMFLATWWLSARVYPLPWARAAEGAAP